MKLFERTGGYWLFYISAAYFLIGMFGLFYNGATSVWLSPLYIFFLAMPFWFPPLGRSINLDVTWDRDMFNFFKGKQATNVVPFPNQPEYGDGDGPPPQEPKKPPVTYYTLGMTSENRLELRMGYSAITMNHGGVVNLIEQLETFKKQLADLEGIEDE